MSDSNINLKYVPIFSELSEDYLDQIEKLGIIRDYKKNSLILSKSTAGSGLYVITKGKVKVAENNSEGAEIIIEILGEHECFGEMSLIDNKFPSADVIAMEDSELFFLARDEFLRVLKENPNIGIALLEEMTRRLRMSDMKIKSLSISDAEGKIAAAILQLAESTGTIHQGAVQVTLPYQHDIANLAGTSRETVSRVLHSLGKRGLIEVDGSRIKIHNYSTFRKNYS